MALLSAWFTALTTGISFTAPWVLTGLIVLPLLWWLLRLSPPTPREVRFPAFALLNGLTGRSQVAATSPFWLIVLRGLIVSLILLALSGPVINPDRAKLAGGPMIVLLDNSWAAAPEWPARMEYLDGLLLSAASDERQVSLITTSDPNTLADGELTFLPAAQWRERIASITPHPWNKDLSRLAERLDHTALPRQAQVLWLHDGLEDDKARLIAGRLQGLGSLTIVTAQDRTLFALADTADPQHFSDTADSPRFRVIRPDHHKAETSLSARLIAEDGRTLARTTGTFSLGKNETDLRFDVPLPLRNEAQAVRLEDQSHAGALYILESGWHRPIVGLVQTEATDADRTLLDGAYYLRKALAPHAEVIEGNLQQHLDGNTDLLLMDDEGRVNPNDQDRLLGWVRRGGILLRFAGPRLVAASAEQIEDPLLPAPLRQGGRSLSGALTWTKPLPIGAFGDTSPLSDLDTPEDILIRKQVLSEPGLSADAQVWARLTDGTPLITARQDGRGWIVLIHTGASPAWSDLPFSGLFVGILDRLAQFATKTGSISLPSPEEGPGELVLQQRITAFGELENVDGGQSLLLSPGNTSVRPSAAIPPGIYQTGVTRKIVNLLTPDDSLHERQNWPAGVISSNLDNVLELPLKGWLLGAAMILFLIDTLVILAHKGLLPWRFGPTGIAAVLAIAILLPNDLKAAPDDNKAELSALNLRLAYIATGDATIDRMSERGLVGLSNALARRTAVEPAYPMALNPDQDELLFYPLVYWPVIAEQPVSLSETALYRIRNYLADGGTILFDTQIELNTGRPTTLSNSPELKSQLALRSLLDGLDLPPLALLNRNHILTRSFYLLSEFPGRYQHGQVWVEETSSNPWEDETSLRDGVSSVIIGSNDWAAAWAMDENGYPMASLVSGDQNQREMAYRFGINLVMYALTGNYKADQVHAPAILERLGQ